MMTTREQRELLHLLDMSPRGYVTRTAEGTRDLLALGHMRMACDIYEMASGGFIGRITKRGREALTVADPAEFDRANPHKGR